MMWVKPSSFLSLEPSAGLVASLACEYSVVRVSWELSARLSRCRL
jgi:hypothetical protein